MTLMDDLAARGKVKRRRASRHEFNDDPLWYKDAVLYELHVRAFFDSNDDGIGDLPGLIQKLDYLQDLGVTCLWLLPFFPSPLKDDGYDISDYLNVHPMYGTMEDFRAFLAAAHERELQVMIDGKLVTSVPLYPTVNVPQGGIWSRLSDTVLLWFQK